MERASRHAAVAAVLLALAAMALYPGGSANDRSARHYSVFRNSLSDLGAGMAVNGEPNRASAISFAASGIALALAATLCLIGLVRAADARARHLTGAAAAMGVAACIGLAAAVTTPKDASPLLHVTFSFVSSVALAGAVTAIALAGRADERTPRRRVVIAWSLLLSTLILWLVSIRLSPAILDPAVPVTLQKLLALALVTAVFLQSLETESRRRADAVATASRGETTEAGSHDRVTGLR